MSETASLRLPHESAVSMERKASVFIRLNKAVGPYGAVLFFFAIAVAGIGVAAGWMVRQDVVLPVVKGHVEYLKTETDQRKQLVNSQNQISSALSDAVNELKGMKDETAKTHELQEKTHLLLEAQTEWHRRAVEESRKTNQLLQNSRIKVSNGPEAASKEASPMDDTNGG